MKISASIVIYNENKETLQKVIDSFLSLAYDKELVIMDNSPENVLESFCSAYENVKYIFSGQNLGFGRGHNLAFKEVTKSDIHLILNPDIYFDGKSINAFLEWFYKERDVSLAIPNVLNIDGSVQKVVREIPTPLSLLKRKLGIDTVELEIPVNMVQEIPFAHGCFFTFRYEVYEQLEGFDERYFMYMEDVDIWIRAKKYGKTVINTNYAIYHEHRKGSAKSIKLFFYHICSAVQFFANYKTKAI